jgi:hypothetical protein
LVFFRHSCAGGSCQVKSPDTHTLNSFISLKSAQKFLFPWRILSSPYSFKIMLIFLALGLPICSVLTHYLYYIIYVLNTYVVIIAYSLPL